MVELLDLPGDGIGVGDVNIRVLHQHLDITRLHLRQVFLSELVNDILLGPMIKSQCFDLREDTNLHSPEAVFLVSSSEVRNSGWLHPLRRVLHDLGLVHLGGEGSHGLGQSSHEESQDAFQEAALVTDVVFG